MTICSVLDVVVFGGVERILFLLVALEVAAQKVAEAGGVAAVARSLVGGGVGCGGSSTSAGSSNPFSFFFFG